MFRHLPLELHVVKLGCINGRYRKDRVKAIQLDFLLFLFGVLILGNGRNIGQLAKSIESCVSLGLMVKVVEDISNHFGNALRGKQCRIGVDCFHLLVLAAFLLLDRIDVVNSERKNIAIVDSIDNGIGVQLITESLFCGTQIRIAARFCVLGENRSACESEDMVVLEELCNFDVHISELAAVALIEDKNKVFAQHRVLRILGNEIVELLNGGNNDFVLVRIALCIFILKLPL